MKLLRRLAAGLAMLATVLTITVAPLSVPAPSADQVSAITIILTLPTLPDHSWNS